MGPARLACALALVVAIDVSAQPAAVRGVIVNGATSASGSTRTLTGVAGQPAVGAMAGGGLIVSGGRFASPTLAGSPSLQPSVGTTAGGTRVTMLGNGFTPAATVTFDGLPAALVEYVDATSIVAFTPPHAAGTVSVVVDTGATVFTLAGAYRYVTPPVSDTTDSDGDGMPDTWELRYSLNPQDPLDAAYDPDTDGLTSLQEFQRDSHPRGLVTRYLAEGATSTFFDMRIALLNPTASPKTVLHRYLLSGGTVQTAYLVVPPLTRATIDPRTTLGNGTSEFSTTVEADGLVIVDRTMTWDRATGYGSHAETSIVAPSTNWYLAEGSTRAGFQLFYLVQNPDPTAAATVTVEYLLPAPAMPVVRSYGVGPNSRQTIWVNTDGALSSTDVSASITSDRPVIVERAMYRNSAAQTFAAGHESAGVTAPSTDWFLAEGATGSFFDLFVLMANPGSVLATCDVRFLLPTGTVVSRPTLVPARSRENIWVDAEGGLLADTAVSTTVSCDQPIIVERAMWWPGSSATWTEAHNSAGATTTGTRWALAEGEQGGTRSTETYILIANTSPFDGQARVTLHFEDGTSAQQVVAVSANSRSNVAVGAPTTSGGFGATVQNRRFGAVIESLVLAGAGQAAQLVVERAMYSNAGGVVWAAGTNALATKLP